MSQPASSPRPPAFAMEVINNPDSRAVLIAAHRGAWLTEPENSVPALEACIALGVAIMEIDVQLTADEQLVVNHDATIDRMTNGSGYVRDHTLAALQALRLYERDGAPCDIWKRKLLTNERLASLAEIFEAARGRILLNLEIKSNVKYGLVETFAAARRLALDMNIADHVLWKIPASTRPIHPELLSGFKGDLGADSLATTVVNGLDTTGLPTLAPIIWQSNRSFEQQIREFDDYANTPVFEIVAQDLSYWPTDGKGRLPGSERYCYMGVAVLPEWCAGLSDEVALRDPDAAWGRLIDLGCRIVMTDRPEKLVEYLSERGLMAGR